MLGFEMRLVPVSPYQTTTDDHRYSRNDSFKNHISNIPKQFNKLLLISFSHHGIIEAVLDITVFDTRIIWSVWQKMGTPDFADLNELACEKVR